MSRLACRKCDPVIWKHEDGWDIYPGRETYRLGTERIPAWFDAPLIEDAPTKTAAVAEWREMHALGFCLYESRLR